MGPIERAARLERISTFSEALKAISTTVLGISETREKCAPLVLWSGATLNENVDLSKPSALPKLELTTEGIAAKALYECLVNLDRELTEFNSVATNK